MLADFDSLGEDSRVWIYQSDKKLSEEEKEKCLSAAEGFLKQWAAHGTQLHASATILHHHFLVIATDQSFHMASGCSIDSSFRFVQELGEKLKVDFFQRTNIAFFQHNKVLMVKMKDIKQAVEEGQISPESLFFDNTIQTKGQLKNDWLQKAGESWLNRYFKSATSV